MIEFRSRGRKVSRNQFFKNLERKALDLALEKMKSQAHGVANSIVDPETGKHPPVFVRRQGYKGLVIRTMGSPAYARELERRLGGEAEIMALTDDQSAEAVPHVYLAHAFEDHERLAMPLAERMMRNGVEVWLDK